LRAVKCCSWQSAKRFRKRLRSYAAYFGERSIAQPFRQERRASNRCCTTAAEKPHFRNTSRGNARSQLEDVPADRVADLYRCSSIGQLSGVARIPKMIEYGFAEHLRKYGKGSAAAATRMRSRSKKEFYFFAGRYLFWIEAMTT